MPMNKELLKVSLRQQAVYLSQTGTDRPLSAHTLALVAEMRQLGYVFSEPLLHAVEALDESDRQDLLDVVNDVMGTKLNWASLVRGWLVPTGETVWDHFVTLIANVLRENGDNGLNGVTLPCGHFIPEGTFPLERYNGCPFCGTPFHTADFVYKGQGTRLKELQLWTDQQLDAHFASLLQSPVPLDATQRESLKTLLAERPLPQVDIVMKETRLLVVDELVRQERDDEAARLFASPADVLRYLWYRHTGQVQLLLPRTLLHIEQKNRRYELNSQADIDAFVGEKRQQLHLRYDRPWCRRVARWLNGLPMAVSQQLETMHPQREMWVRFIRALRLAEYAKKPGFDQLCILIDRFYRSDYTVWQAGVEASRLRNDADSTLSQLCQRPGLFARCLFSTMLWFGPERTLTAFRTVLTQVPVRLLLTLGGQAGLWFDRNAQRVARPLSGLTHPLPPHPLLAHYTDDELLQMQQAVNQLYLDAMRQHFAAQLSELSPQTSDLRPQPSDLSPQPSTIYIAPQLYDIPVAVGDRSSTIQDTSCALQGTRFHVEGDEVRLFLQWGKDLPAQHLDMDLSCYILNDNNNGLNGLNGNGSGNGNEDKPDVCSYFNLTTEGAQHSGDIQCIPDLVGAAEYVELSLPKLQARGARRVVFTCNAYTDGELSPNLMVGWMSAKEPMTVSDLTGVAYDPSTVQHMVRISESNLSKGLIFGVLDVVEREITWLEMPFDGQTVLSINAQTVDAYLRRLRQKPTIGQVLDIKAEAQGLVKVDTPEQATETYTLTWAMDAATVSRLLCG